MVEALARIGAPISRSACSKLPAKAAWPTARRPGAARSRARPDRSTKRSNGSSVVVAQPTSKGFRLEPAEGVRLIHSVGGFASWAHPNELDGRDWRQYLPAVLEAGIDGLEAYYSKDYAPRDAAGDTGQACAAHGLVPTVGSDFHGFGTLQFRRPWRRRRTCCRVWRSASRACASDPCRSPRL